jgi:hypothetical protein
VRHSCGPCRSLIPYTCDQKTFHFQNVMRVYFCGSTGETGHELLIQLTIAPFVEALQRTELVTVSSGVFKPLVSPRELSRCFVEQEVRAERHLGRVGVV